MENTFNMVQLEKETWIPGRNGATIYIEKNREGIVIHFFFSFKLVKVLILQTDIEQSSIDRIIILCLVYKTFALSKLFFYQNKITVFSDNILAVFIYSKDCK